MGRCVLWTGASYGPGNRLKPISMSLLNYARIHMYYYY